MVEKSENITNLAGALLKAQKQMGSALKDAENPYYKSNYADLKAVIDAIKEPLNANGITFLQAVNGSGDSNPVVETMLLHESGQYLCAKTPVFCAKPNNPQAFGSGVTYSKRYALQAFLGLPTKDDDGNAGTDINNKAKKQQPVKKTEQNEIVDQAFFEFECEQKESLLEGFAYSKEKFTEAIIKHFKKLPARKDSIKKILATVKPEEVMAEIPQKGAEQLRARVLV